MHSPENLPPEPDHNDWLNRLQQDSWQLELIVSGFVIFLLLGGLEPLSALDHTLTLMAQNQEVFFLGDFFYSLLRVAYLALLIFLLIHLVLRGLWIAAIGLRSVSGDIDYDRFRFAPKFINRIRQRTGSFDDYIIRLERWCSVFFSLAFLIVFCFLSLVSFGATIFVIQFLVTVTVGNGDLFNSSSDNIVGNMMTILGGIYLLDFITLGALKRIRYANQVYYYLYVFMGWISLARLYRPLYYNLIDNGFGRRLAVATPFIVLLVMLFSAAELIKYPYMPDKLGTGSEWILSRLYDDEGADPETQLWLPSLKSRYVKNDYVELFVPYIPINDDETLLLIDSTLEVARYAGLTVGKPFGFSQPSNPDADSPALLRAFNELRRVYVNDSLLNVLPRFSNHVERRQSGVVYMIPAHDLSTGEHTVRVDKRMQLLDTASYSKGYRIYFYK